MLTYYVNKHIGALTVHLAENQSISLVCIRSSSMNHLHAKRKDTLPLPKELRHKRLSRSISPALWSATQSMEEGSYVQLNLEVPDISKSLLTLHQQKNSSSDSSANSSLKVPKSHANQFCFGRTRKKLHRHAHVNEAEIYRTQSLADDTADIPERSSSALLTVPEVTRRRRSSAASALGTLIKQTFRVTKGSMGLKMANSEEKLHQQHFSKSLDDDVEHRFSRSSNSVSTLTFASSDASMAPLQCREETRSATCLNSNTNNNHKTNSNNCLNSSRLNAHYEYTTSALEDFDIVNHTANDCRILHRNESRSFKTYLSQTTQQQLDSSSTRSNSPAVLGRQSSQNTAKHEQQKTSTSSTTAAATTTITTTMSSVAAAATEKKDKKRKEVSSSRIKKFHRHFPQICKDEKLINYFSCALVSDILLQGHLYITDTHFAFYSNVFGYITKVLIPTSSVTRVSKEKTAKIIPNAVGVATADERHVFGSFISREAAFRLMCSVCPRMAPTEIAPTPTTADVEVFEEYSIEDDSSCSISGNESLPLLLDAGLGTAQMTLIKRSVANHAKDIPNNAKSTTNSIASSQTSTQSASEPVNLKRPVLIVAGSASSSTTSLASTPTASTTSAPTTVALAGKKHKSAAKNALNRLQILVKQILLRLKFPTELHVIYLGVLLTIMLAMFSIFLLYRILNIEAKAQIYHSTADFNWRTVNDDNLLVEALRWQKQLQEKSAEEAQHILHSNLEQIGKVRRSLETLSLLIQERSAATDNVNHNEGD